MGGAEPTSKQPHKTKGLKADETALKLSPRKTRYRPYKTTGKAVLSLKNIKTQHKHLGQKHNT
jgi:hypothetical protein